MSKWFRASLLLAAAVGFIGLTAPFSTSTGQEKKAKAGRTTGVVQVNEGKDGKFRLIIRDSEDKYLATSGAYATKADALKGLDTLKSTLENPKIVDTKSEKKAKKEKE
jgi:uncharacterized protein YegP (UPF0339 family)